MDCLLHNATRCTLHQCTVGMACMFNGWHGVHVARCRYTNYVHVMPARDKKSKGLEDATGGKGSSEDRHNSVSWESRYVSHAS